MKTTIAVIRLVLRTNKVLSTKQHPIMLRCSFHGMKEVSTGYSCSVNLLKIATETGKSVKTIHQYLTYLNDEDLV